MAPANSPLRTRRQRNMDQTKKKKAQAANLAKKAQAKKPKSAAAKAATAKQRRHAKVVAMAKAEAKITADNARKRAGPPREPTVPKSPKTTPRKKGPTHHVSKSPRHLGRAMDLAQHLKNNPSGKRRKHQTSQKYHICQKYQT